MLNVEVSQVLGQFDLAEHRLIKLSLIDFCGDLFHRFRGAMLSFNRFIHINRIGQIRTSPDAAFGLQKLV